MNLADELAEAVFSIQQNSRTQYERAKSELLARREESRQALANSSEVEDLNQRRPELEQSVWRMEEEVAALQNKVAEMGENNLKQRRIVLDLLLKVCEERLDQTKIRRVSLDFHSAFEAFGEQLAERGFNAAAATEEELVRVLRELQPMASWMRATANKLALEASGKLDEAQAVQSRWEALNAQREQVEREFELTLERLRSHGQNTEEGLVGEIRKADKRIAQRLLREIIESKLVDSRIERTKGLIGADPLQKLEREMAL